MAIRGKIKFFKSFVGTTTWADSPDYMQEFEDRINKWLDDNNVVIKDKKITTLKDDTLLVCIEYIEIPKKELMTEKKG